MGDKWKELFNSDPLSPLVDCGYESVRYFVKRDLIEEDPGDICRLWELKEAQGFVRRQKDGGWWKYPGKDETDRFPEDYIQLETYRILGFLVEKYGFDKRSPVIRKAAEFLFSCQDTKGDFRGIYGNQYSPNYSAAIMELLIKAGYSEDKRILKAFDWLLSIRQDDGGWAIPLRTVTNTGYTEVVAGKTLEPDTSRPFSHLATGVVLRAFAAHPKYRESKVAKKALRLLVPRLFEKDKYPDRKTLEFWLGFSFPFWFTDIITVLDLVSVMGIEIRHPKVKKAMDWLISHQGKDGLWKLRILKTKYRDQIYWLSYVICRIFKRIYK